MGGGKGELQSCHVICAWYSVHARHKAAWKAQKPVHKLCHTWPAVGPEKVQVCVSTPPDLHS